MICFRGDPVESNIMNDITLRIITAAKAVIRVFARGGGQLNRNTFLGKKIYQWMIHFFRRVGPCFKSFE